MATPAPRVAEYLAELSALSESEDVVLVEMVYRGKWVRFDISSLQAGCLTYPQMGKRIFEKAFQALGIDRSGVPESSESETSDTQE